MAADVTDWAPHDEVSFEIADKVGWLTFNRPAQMNAITLDMARSLSAISLYLDEAARSDAVRVVIIRGAGEKAFCSGADLKERGRMSESELWEHADLIKKFVIFCYQSLVPVIAAVHGYCLGGGLEIAVACDLRVAATTATMGFTEARIGAFPGAGGAVYTPRLVGIGVAKDLLYTGRRISGSEAQQLGLVNSAVPLEDLIPHAKELASTIASNGPLAVRSLKQLLNRGPEQTIEDAFELSDSLRRPLNSTMDYAEGLAAFAERRAPVFRGM
jgi:methylglutaconyl-CoA hydratase